MIEKLQTKIQTNEERLLDIENKISRLVKEKITLEDKIFNQRQQLEVLKRKESRQTAEESL
jgi:predicted  nucleic acid-binding Zn-ribbon protein